MHTNQGVADTYPQCIAELGDVKEPCPGLCSTLLVHAAMDFLAHPKAQNQDICVLSSDNNRLVARFCCMESMEKYRRVSASSCDNLNS